MAHSKIVTSLDFLVAKVRAKHGRIYEGQRLLALLRFRSLPELAHELLPGEPVSGAVAFERRLVEKYAETAAQLWQYMDGPRGELIWTTGARLAIENLKVMLRSRAAGSTVRISALPLVRLPEPFNQLYRNVPEQATAREIVAAISQPVLRQNAEQALLAFGDNPLPLVLEAGLDRGYFRLLAEALDDLKGDDRKAVEPLLEDESRIANLMMVLRGRVYDGVDADLLASLAVPSPTDGRPPDWLRRVARQSSLREMLAEAPTDLRHVADEAPNELPAIERSLWIWYYGKASRLFRTSFFNIGAVYAYLIKRRLELANLITVVEALRYDLSLEETRKRLLDPLSKF